MSNKHKLLSVIIVSYKNLDVLGECLDSIQKFNDIGDGLETIVVEQSEDSGIPTTIRARWPWATVIENENVGFGGGNNRGAISANGDYLLFLNPDTVIIEPVFSFAAQKFSDDDFLGAFGVRLISKEGNHNRSFHFRKPYGLFRSAVWRVCDHFDWFMPNAMYIAGADLFVRASSFQEIGGFDERMFMYFEETYLCERLNDIGMKIGYFPQKRIVHLEGKSSGNVNTLLQQIKSLKYLCDESGWSYSHVLRRMRQDRIFKTLMGSDRSDEIALINDTLNEELG